jgi:hypothetical protein
VWQTLQRRLHLSLDSYRVPFRAAENAVKAALPVESLGQIKAVYPHTGVGGPIQKAGSAASERPSTCSNDHCSGPRKLGTGRSAGTAQRSLCYSLLGKEPVGPLAPLRAGSGCFLNDQQDDPLRLAFYKLGFSLLASVNPLRWCHSVWFRRSIPTVAVTGS